MPEIVTPPALTRFIGCDVGKATIVVFDSLDRRFRTIANTPAALAAFAASLDAACFAVCEATGGYEDALLAALLAATIPVFQRAGVPFIVWGAISPKITERNNPMVSRVVTTLVNTNEPLAAWAAQTIGTSIAIVSDTSDYGAANTKNFSTFYTAAGGRIVATEAAPVGTTDFRALLTKIKALSPDAVYFGGVVTEAGLVRQQMAELGMSMPMIGVDGFDDADFIKIAGPAADGTVAGIVKEKGNPQLAKLTQDYQAAKFAEPSTTYTKNAYDAANIIVEALKKAGTKDKAAIAKAIRETQYDGAMGHTSFDENGQTKLPVELELRTVKNGAWTTR